LISEKNYSKDLLNEERQIQVNGILKRYDIVSFSSNGTIELIVECKAPSVNITQQTFDQIARYNMALKSRLFNDYQWNQSLTFCQMDYENET